MKRFIPLLTIGLLALLTFLPTASVRADVGPHPTMDFSLIWSIPRVAVTDASLFTCAEITCANPVKVAGPFSCSEESCRYNYGGSGFYQLEIVFTDKTRSSNIFEKRGFEATFDVQVMADGLIVDQTNLALPYVLPLQGMGFLVALPVTLVIETMVAFIILKRWNLPRRWWIILLANVISLPIVWFLFPFLPTSAIVTFTTAEIFAITVEAIFYYLTMRKELLTLKQSVVLSLLANLSSVAIPFLCYYLLSMFSYQ